MAADNKETEASAYMASLGKPDMTVERAKAVATIVITAGVNVANIYGYSVDAEPLVNAVLTIISFAMILWSWWKNQNITEQAGEAQLLLNMLKKGQHSKEAGNGKSGEDVRQRGEQAGEQGD